MSETPENQSKWQMQRKDREITSIEDIEAIIRRAAVCRLAMTDGRQPYIVPLCFGYQDATLYFHSALWGRKIDILRQNPNVCFEFDIDCEIKPAPQACKMGMHYSSVIGWGQAVFITDPDLKQQALEIIRAQYTPQKLAMTAVQIKQTLVFKVPIQEMTGKSA